MKDQYPHSNISCQDSVNLVHNDLIGLRLDWLSNLTLYVKG